MITTGKPFTFAFALVIFLASASKPNPCGFRSNGKIAFKCKKGTCAGSFLFKRTPFCAKLKRKNHCFCSHNSKPVCCQVKGYWASVTITRANKCACKCFKGKVLFKGKCDSPPSKAAACPKILLPTCCYILKFDLTVTASNKCDCKNQLRGVPVKQSICGL